VEPIYCRLVFSTSFVVSRFVIIVVLVIVWVIEKFQNFLYGKSFIFITIITNIFKVA